MITLALGIPIVAGVVILIVLGLRDIARKGIRYHNRGPR